MATITTYLDTRRKSVSGLYRVLIVVRSHNTVGYISTEIMIEPKNWVNKKIVGTKQDRQLNHLLDMQLSALKLKLVSYSATHNVKMMTGRELADELAPDMRRRKVQVKDKTIVSVFWQSFIGKKDKTKTAQTYKFTWKNLCNYCDAENLKFSDITYSWLTEYDRWLKGNGNAINTRSIHMRNIRAVYNEAIREGVMSQDSYPFKQFRIKTEETAKRSLSVEDLRILRDFKCEDWQRQYLDAFFISFYLCGINMVDLLQLPKAINNHIEYKRSKTGILCQMDIPQEALQLIKKYEGKNLMLRFCEERNDYEYFIKSMNRALQKIGEIKYVVKKTKAGILRKTRVVTPMFKGLTSYWARHTWATIAADIDISDAVIDAALGHKSPYPMTDIYIRRNAKKVDNAVRAVIDYVNKG